MSGLFKRKSSKEKNSLANSKEMISKSKSEYGVQVVPVDHSKYTPGVDKGVFVKKDPSQIMMKFSAAPSVHSPVCFLLSFNLFCYVYLFRFFYEFCGEMII